MVRFHELFHTYAQASHFREEILRDYPPAQYGTVLQVRHTREGFWQCVGARFPT